MKKVISTITTALFAVASFAQSVIIDKTFVSSSNPSTEASWSAWGTDLANLKADNNWFCSDAARYQNESSVYFTTPTVLTANGQELNYTKGLEFVFTSPARSAIRMDPNPSRGLSVNNLCSIVIPDLQKGDYIAFSHRTSANGSSRTWTVTNATLTSGTLTSSTGVFTVAELTVDADGSVSLNPSDAMSIDHITVTRGHSEGAQQTTHDESGFVPEGYILDWSDEFDGTSLNTQDWVHEVQGPGWVNSELQTYVNGSADGKRVTELVDDRLNINCFKGTDGKIYSGRIYAKRSTGWQYGYIEARIKLPKGKGTWPAFWMMPVNFRSWPADGEIDIMEEVGYHPNYVSSSLHATSHVHSNGTQVTHEMYCQGAENEYHIYAIKWTANNITTYVDGKVQLSYDNRGLGKDDWPYDAPFYIILNLAWGGTWGGAQGIDESALPCQMQVDYVRVYKNSNEVSNKVIIAKNFVSSDNPSTEASWSAWSTDLANLKADNNWFCSDAARYQNETSVYYTTPTALTANGQELNYTKGLEFTFTEPSIGAVRFDPNSSRGLAVTNYCSIVIPDLKEGDQITFYHRTGKNGDERTWTATNATLTDGTLTSNVGVFTSATLTVDADGSVTLTPSDLMSISSITVTRPTTTGINSIADNTIADNNLNVNIAGQAVDESFKGIVICNGKKFVRK